MPEESSIEYHTPHEAMVEHHAHGGHGNSDGLAQRVALTTAILATIGALFGYQSGQVQTKAMLLKNDAITKVAQASDQWSYYQAKSTRQYLVTGLGAIATDDKVREKFKAEAERYEKEKAEIKDKAEKLDEEAKKLDELSEAKIVPHERMALGVTLMQVAVALASITVLTRQKWLYVGALCFAAAGIGVAIWGYTIQ